MAVDEARRPAHNPGNKDCFKIIMRSNLTSRLHSRYRLLIIPALVISTFTVLPLYINSDAIVRARAVDFAHSLPATTKRIPNNAVTPTYTDEMAASDSALAAIFGGAGAMAAANGFEPVGLGSQYPFYRGDLVGDDGLVRRGHLSYAMHLYGSPDGTGEIGVYVPRGFTAHSAEPTPTDAAVTFYYPRLGNIADVTLVVFHIANFRLTPDGERIRIGEIGGRGGSIASYKHSHIEFFRGKTGLPSAAVRNRLRIDPVVVFASPTATASR